MPRDYDSHVGATLIMKPAGCWHRPDVPKERPIGASEAIPGGMRAGANVNKKRTLILEFWDGGVHINYNHLGVALTKIKVGVRVRHAVRGAGDADRCGSMDGWIKLVRPSLFTLGYSMHGCMDEFAAELCLCTILCAKRPRSRRPGTSIEGFEEKEAVRVV